MNASEDPGEGQDAQENFQKKRLIDGRHRVASLRQPVLDRRVSISVCVGQKMVNSKGW